MARKFGICNKMINKSRKQALFWLIISLFIVSGCSLLGGTDEPAPADAQAETDGNVGLEAVEQVPIVTQRTGTLQCTEECRGYGQCGTSVADANMSRILGGNQPQTNAHTLWFPDGASVNILTQENRSLRLSNGQQIDQPFFQINLAEPAKTGWVAGWCIREP